MTQSKTCSQKFQAVSPELKELGAFDSWELKLAQRTKAESRKKERCGKDDSGGLLKSREQEDPVTLVSGLLVGILGCLLWKLESGLHHSLLPKGFPSIQCLWKLLSLQPQKWFHYHTSGSSLDKGSQNQMNPCQCEESWIQSWTLGLSAV